MSLVHIGLILLFLILFLIGSIVILRSTQIVNWVFNWSTNFLKEFGDIYYHQEQRATSLWIIRIFAGLMMSVCVLFLYILLSDFYW
jgi:hypothetical protein